jgi:hypothetical protein
MAEKVAANGDHLKKMNIAYHSACLYILWLYCIAGSVESPMHGLLTALRYTPTHMCPAVSSFS